jgi:hypothetical protein
MVVRTSPQRWGEIYALVVLRTGAVAVETTAVVPRMLDASTTTRSRKPRSDRRGRNVRPEPTVRHRRPSRERSHLIDTDDA